MQLSSSITGYRKRQQGKNLPGTVLPSVSGFKAGISFFNNTKKNESVFCPCTGIYPKLVRLTTKYRLHSIAEHFYNSIVYHQITIKSADYEKIFTIAGSCLVYITTAVRTGSGVR